jgi:hypothetical protein
MATFSVRSRMLTAIATTSVTATTAEAAIAQVVATGASAGYEIQVLSCV